MIKVVFVLKQVVLRLKDCEFDVLIKKNKEVVILCARSRISNGFASLNTTT